jgi:hypothetical protein
MPDDAFTQWADRFQYDALKDNMALLRKHLNRVGLPDEPEKLITGTIMYMNACCAYLSIDGRSYDDFLAMQAYHPELDTNSHYSFTFNLFKRTFGRIITPLDLKCLDFADLHHHPWDAFKTCGYSDVRVARLDGNDLSQDEMQAVEKAVTEDIRFDYSEDEVDVWFDQYTIDGILLVYCEDRFLDDINWV